MGGYMGFGLQKWIYSRKPRIKLYERERITSFTSLPKYSRTFKLQPSATENKKYMGLITVIVGISFIVIISFAYRDFIDYSNNHTKQITVNYNNQNKKAFNFLIKSGKNRLKENRVLDAYSEFSLAYNINPNDENLNHLLIETLSVLCNENISYCNELDNMLDTVSNTN